MKILKITKFTKISRVLDISLSSGEWKSRIAHQFSFSLNLVGKIQMIKTVKNEFINSKTKAPKIINSSTFFWVPTSWTAQPNSKPAVNRQPGFRREDSSSLLPHPNLQWIMLEWIFEKNQKNRKILKILKITKFTKFPGNSPAIERMNSRIAPYFSFLLNFVGKLQMLKTIKNELDNSKKKAPKITNSSTFFWRN